MNIKIKYSFFSHNIKKALKNISNQTKPYKN